MGLDIGIITIEYLERPRGRAYEFAWELAVEASVNGYMHGEGNNWAPFTQRQVLRMLDEFARDKNLSTQEKADVWAWVESLPWDGWEDNLAPVDPTDAYYDSVLDYDQQQDGGYIELHFNW